MLKQYSITEARNHFTSFVHTVEQETAIELTRHGKPVAVLLSIQEYKRLSSGRASFWEALSAFRHKVNLKALNLESDIFAGLRDHSPGREVTW